MRYNILLIEDSPEMADNITGILELALYSVTHAPNGKIGVALAQKQLPDLILCDVMMPELDGYGVLHILNNDPVTAFIPFIFLTAKADQSDVRAGMILGADDYITKPFDDVDLLKVLEIRLKKSEFIRAANAPQQVSAFFNKAREVKELKMLSENRPVKTLRKNSIIFMEGQIPNDLYFIERGKIRTYKVNTDGKELITGIHNEGSFFGYLPLLEEAPYQENAAALEEAKIAIIPKDDFLRLLYTSKDVARNFIRLLSNNLSEMETRLIDVAYQSSVRQRVARVLLQLDDTLQQGETFITTTRRDIANIVGTATESLNRTLADFRDEGLIDISGNGLMLRCREKLQRLMYG